MPKQAPPEAEVEYVPAVAAMLSVHESTFYRLARRGEVRVVHLGRRVLVPKSVVRALLAGEVSGER